MQKVNVNNKVSAWEDIYSGVPRVQYFAHFSLPYSEWAFLGLLIDRGGRVKKPPSPLLNLSDICDNYETWRTYTLSKEDLRNI